eukprot:359068-Chlamydomonas_euryale.AAC.6
MYGWLSGSIAFATAATAMAAAAGTAAFVVGGGSGGGSQCCCCCCCWRCYACPGCRRGCKGRRLRRCVAHARAVPRMRAGARGAGGVKPQAEPPSRSLIPSGQPVSKSQSSQTIKPPKAYCPCARGLQSDCPAGRPPAPPHTSPAARAGANAATHPRGRPHVRCQPSSAARDC